MANEASKAVAENKVKELETEEQRLRWMLESQELLNSGAEEQYGSELCAGEMFVSENKTRIEISQIRCDINLLRKFIENKLDIFKERQLRKNLREVASQVMILQDSDRLIEEELVEIIKVRKLLN